MKRRLAREPVSVGHSWTKGSWGGLTLRLLQDAVDCAGAAAAGHLPSSRLDLCCEELRNVVPYLDIELVLVLGWIGLHRNAQLQPSVAERPVPSP